jgi:hypothetical protein
LLSTVGFGKSGAALERVAAGVCEGGAVVVGRRSSERIRGLDGCP